MRLTASCDTAGATEIPSDRDGHAPAGAGRPGEPARTSADRYYVFDGGCITVRLHPGRRRPRRAAGGGDPGHRRGARARTSQDQVREESGGRLELDPPRREGS